MPDVSNSNVLTFKDEFRVDMQTDDGVKSLNRLNVSSGCTFNIQSGRPDKNTSENNKRYRLKL